MQGTCHALGRNTGTCGTYGCTCSDEFLTPDQFLLCAAASTCRMDCQVQQLDSYEDFKMSSLKLCRQKVTAQENVLAGPVSAGQILSSNILGKFHIKCVVHQINWFG